MTADLVAAAQWLKERSDSTGKIGVVGFFFGGGIANALAVRMGEDLEAALSFFMGPASCRRRAQNQGGHAATLRVNGYPTYSRLAGL